MRVISVVALLLTVVVAQVMCSAIDREREDLLQILEKVKVKRTEDEDVAKWVKTFKAADKATQLETLKGTLTAAGKDANKAQAILDGFANADEATIIATVEKILKAIDPDKQEAVLKAASRRDKQEAVLKAASRRAIDRELDDLLRILETDMVKRTEVEERQPTDCLCPSGMSYDESCCPQVVEICFPATASVTLATGDVITMEELRSGQQVMTVSSDGKLVPSEVRTFMHRDTEVVSRYLQLETAIGQKIALSPTHLIYSTFENNTGAMTPRYAKLVNIGDYVMVTSTSGGGVQAAMVVDIQTQWMKGAYVPLTEHGTLLVDDVMASCYASFQHDLAHVVMSPMRWWPSLFQSSDNEEGCRPYVRFMKALGRWILPQSLLSDRVEISHIEELWPVTDKDWMVSTCPIKTDLVTLSRGPEICVP